MHVMYICMFTYYYVGRNNVRILKMKARAKIIKYKTAKINRKFLQATAQVHV